jgi:hypothetical protein
MSEAPSPLTVADPDSLTALFSSDPLTHTDAQLADLCRELRRRRSVFASEEAAKALSGKKARAPKGTDPSASASLDKPTSELNLGDL